MIKIFGFPVHQSKVRTSGVDFLRIIQPLTHLNGHDKIKTTVMKTNKSKKTWLEVAQQYDIIYMNYTVDVWQFAELGAFARKYGKKIVVDLDDDLFNILEDNPVWNVWKKDGEGVMNLKSMINEVDAITCTNSYLKNVIAFNTEKTHDKIKVFPNYIDLDLYKHRSEFKNTNHIQITHFGSSTHWNSLQDEEFFNGMDRIMKEYPNVSFKTVGATIAKYKMRWGQRYENDFGHVDIYKWASEKFPIFADQTDIFVAPLTNNLYNRCKSDTKYNEACSAIKPFVGQDIRQYQETINDGVDGFLCNNADDWYNKLKKLIDSPELRKSMGEAAFKRVERDKQIQNHVQDYADFFRSLVPNK